MDELFQRFPHLSESILLELNPHSLVTCREVSRTWKESTEVEKKLWLKVIKDYTECSDELLEKILEEGEAPIILISILKKIYIKFPKGTKQRHPFVKKCGNTPLHIAAGNGHVAIYRLIMEKVEDKNPMGQNLPLMKIKGQKPNQLKTYEYIYHEQEYTPLHLAALNGHFSTCKLILENVVEKNPENYMRFTPLHLAAANDNHSIVKMIIESIQGNKNPRDQFGNTPLHIAAAYGHFEICVLVLSYDEIANSFMESYQDRGAETLCHLAAANGHIDIYKLIIERKLDGMNSKNRREQWPLHHAALYGHLDICKLILENTQNKDVCKQEDVFGYSPFILANANNHYEIQKLFLAEMAPSNMKRSSSPSHEKYFPTEESPIVKKKK